MRITSRCVDCNAPNKGVHITGSFQCESCNDKLINRIKQNYRNIEKLNESRLQFLVRRAKELDINITEKQIKTLIRNGHEDWQILNTKRISVWTRNQGSNSEVRYL